MVRKMKQLEVTELMRKIFSARSHAKDVDFALFCLRIVIGLAFMMHGWGKIQTPFAWMGPEAPVPGIFQFLAALSEFGGGLALILGLLTRLAALGLSFTMGVAVFMHAVVRGDPFVSQGGGPAYELAAVYLFFAIFVVVYGPGRFSLDRKVFGLK